MKLFGAVMVLCAASGVSAFVTQAPESPKTCLSMSSLPGNNGPQTRTMQNNGGPFGNQGSPLSNFGRGNRGQGNRGQRSMQTATDRRRDNRGNNRRNARGDWDDSSIKIQGSSLRTWSFQSPRVQAVQVSLRTEGRPLNADVDLWQGPDNTPQKMGLYLEDGDIRPFNGVIATPGGENTVAIRNTAQMEFPLSAKVESDLVEGENSAGLSQAIMDLESIRPEIVQGGAVKTYSFAPSVASVQCLLKTDGRPLNARIELLQGPNNNKQVMEVYTEDGLSRPLFVVMESPGSGNVVRIVNTAPMEFPLSARVEPFMVDNEGDNRVIIDGGMVREDRTRERGGFFSDVRDRMSGLPL